MPDFSKVQRERPLVVTASTDISLIIWLVIGNLTIGQVVFQQSHCLFLAIAIQNKKLYLTPWAFFFLLRRLRNRGLEVFFSSDQPKA